METNILPIAFKLQNPITVGGKRWGMVQSTRLYIPGWTFWGCLVRALVQQGYGKGADNPFVAAGAAIDKNLWLSHLWYVACDGNEENNEFYILLPVEDENTGRISYCWRNCQNSETVPGEMSVMSVTSTSLLPDKSALDGSLHVREAVSPMFRVGGKLLDVYAVGYIHRKGSDQPEDSLIIKALKSQGLVLGRSSGVGQGDIVWNEKILKVLFQNIATCALTITEFEKVFSFTYYHLAADEDSISYRGEWEPIVLRRFDVEGQKGAGRKIQYFTTALVPGTELSNGKAGLRCHPAGLHGCFCHDDICEKTT